MASGKVHRVGVIMNGVTGRMGANQHLKRSIVPIMRQGGVALEGGDTVMPDPILVGRNAEKLKALCDETGVAAYTTDLNEVLSDKSYGLYFDAQTTQFRVEAVKQAIAAGKDIYCEKPSAETVEDALALYTLARDAGIKHGIVQDKLWLPGLLKLKRLRDEGFFGRILSVRGEFGYWVFEGDRQPAQRPSWNYRKEDGGGIIIDMLCHWRYVLDNLFGAVESVHCLGATHIPTRWDEAGKAYACTADDAAYSSFKLANGIIAHFNSSWCVRVRRDDLLTLQVDGTEGSAVAGLRRCRVQSYAETPRPVWNPDIDNPIDFYEGWREVDAGVEYDNAFKTQWELFLRHVVRNEPFRWGLQEGVKGVQLAELGLQSWREARWLDVPGLSL